MTERKETFEEGLTNDRCDSLDAGLAERKEWPESPRLEIRHRYSDTMGIHLCDKHTGPNGVFLSLPRYTEARKAVNCMDEVRALVEVLESVKNCCMSDLESPCEEAIEYRLAALKEKMGWESRR